jgi:hypothetical protein
MCRSACAKARRVEGIFLSDFEDLSVRFRKGRDRPGPVPHACLMRWKGWSPSIAKASTGAVSLDQVGSIRRSVGWRINLGSNRGAAFTVEPTPRTDCLF